MNIPDNITIPLGRQSVYGTLEVPVGKFPPHVLDYVFNYGLRQVLNDAMADKKDDDGNPLSADLIRAKAEKRLDNMLAGNLRISRESAEPADPIEAEAHKLAKEHLTNVFNKTPYWKDADGKAGKRLLNVINNHRAAKNAEPFDTLSDALDQFLEHESNKKFWDHARRNVKERDDSAKKVDLDAMGF
jgi:hypothetical protein